MKQDLCVFEALKFPFQAVEKQPIVGREWEIAFRSLGDLGNPCVTFWIWMDVGKVNRSWSEPIADQESALNWNTFKGLLSK